jgi:hypothetical protein
MNSLFKEPLHERHPERIQEGENEETYIKRISTFPTLSVETYWIWIFNPTTKETGSILRDWIDNAFPRISLSDELNLYWNNDTNQWSFFSLDSIESFGNPNPPPPKDELSFIFPKRISASEFSKWVIKENILEAWKALGGESTHLAELFIELALDKSTVQINKTPKGKRKKPHPDTDKRRLDYFKNEIFIPLVEKVLTSNPDWQNRQILSDKKVDDALDKCGFPPGKPSEITIKKWIRTARINVGAESKKGRPSR